MKQILVNMCKEAKYLFQGPNLILHMHCWWCTSPPSQVKLTVKLLASPLCIFWFCFKLLICLWHPTCGGLRTNWKMQKYVSALRSEFRCYWWMRCLEASSRCLLGQWLYGFLMQKKRILHLHFCQGSFAAADPALSSVMFQQPHLTAGLWWYFEKQHKASELLQEKNCFVLGKKKIFWTQQFPNLDC